MRTSHWQETTGVVQSWGLEKEHVEGHLRFYGYPNYLYQVGDSYYRGYAIALLDDREELKGHRALKSLKQYPLGSEIRVFVNDENPYDAALDLQQRPQFTTWMEWLLNAFLLIGLILLPLIWFPSRKDRIGIGLLAALIALVVLARSEPYSNADDYVPDGDFNPVLRLIKRTEEQKQTWQELKVNQSVEDPNALAEKLFTDKAKSRTFEEGQVLEYWEESDYDRQREKKSRLVLQKGAEGGWEIRRFESPYAKEELASRLGRKKWKP